MKFKPGAPDAGRDHRPRRIHVRRSTSHKRSPAPQRLGEYFSLVRFRRRPAYVDACLNSAYSHSLPEPLRAW